MARIERKAYYVGTWREDKVTDDIMRQIVARSLAEKGQKVKVKLSESGLVVSRTTLFQESVLCRQTLQDVYFLTVNQRQPCCLLCIVADPVRKYLIVALRTVNSVEAQDLIATFKALKDNPTIESGNVVLKRKDNGNWTLRERSQLNASRHLQEIFLEGEDNHTPAQQPNGRAGGDHVPVMDGSSSQGAEEEGGPKKYRLIPEDGLIVVAPQRDVEGLSQELQDVKLVVENSGSVNPTTLHHNNNNNNNNMDKSYYIETEVIDTEVENGDVITVHSVGSHGHAPQDDHPGEVRVVVEDHRDDGVVRAHSNGQPQPAAVYVRNGDPHHLSPPPAADPRAPNGYNDIPDFKIHRRVSTEYVQVPDFGRKVSGTNSLRSVTGSRVSFDPELMRLSKADSRPFRSLRTSRMTALPSTIVRPIEEVYGHARAPILKRPGAGIYVASPHVAGEPGSVVYLPGAIGNPRLRRSRPNSIHVMEGNELKVFHKTGEKDDILF